MITALWLIVAITVVALQFSVEAHERYTVGINASERGIARAAALGALAFEQAQLERALRNNTGGAGAARLRSSDPWIDADSLFSGVVDIDSLPVDVQVTPGGQLLNINTMGQDALTAFFSSLLGDYAAADEIAQSIMDWRDGDEQARARGGERDAYMKEDRMVLPANAPFRDIDDLMDVRGMTPEIMEKLRPYMRTYGNGLVNLNTAEAPVLRGVPGMTEPVLANILALRANGGRIRTMNDVLPGSSGAQPRPGQGGNPQQTGNQRIAQNSTVDTEEVDLVITARAGPQAQPAQLRATIRKNGNQTTITWRQW
ncbi:MAG: general secretion pathway protein GspK [Phycisphaerae bacterium]|nr:general secretion pathway protein GspK [Gemmatimonadaceae bacterium]